MSTYPFPAPHYSNQRHTGGEQTDSQLFNFTGGSGPLALQPQNAIGACLAVKGKVLDQAACTGEGDAAQSFIFG